MDNAIKQFVVIKKIGDFDGKVVREFDSENDAQSFADLLKSSEDKKYINYWVAEVLL